MRLVENRISSKKDKNKAEIKHRKKSYNQKRKSKKKTSIGFPKTVHRTLDLE